MKNYRKFITVAIVLIFALSVCGNVSAVSSIEAFGEVNTYTCKIQNEKIDDFDILLDRAVNEQNDAPDDVVDVISENCVLMIDGVEQEEKPLITTELISSYVNTLDSSDTIETYAATVISEMKVENAALEAVSLYSKTEQVASSGDEIFLYTTIYYETGTFNGISYISLQGVDVNVDVNVGLVAVKYVRVRYGYRGFNLETEGLVNYESPWNQRNSTSMSLGSINCPPIEYTGGGMYYSIWGEGLAHVQRGSSSWDTTHKVLEAGMGIL